MTAEYGLKVQYRPYKCDVCGDSHPLQTNHTGPCWPPCPNCSWRSGYDSEGTHYRADTGKQRPHYFDGDA